MCMYMCVCVRIGTHDKLPQKIGRGFDEVENDNGGQSTIYTRN